jgi:homoserine O-acetyltransferase
MVAHITYLSEISLDNKFGRRLQSADRLSYDFHHRVRHGILPGPPGQRALPSASTPTAISTSPRPWTISISPGLRTAEGGLCRMWARYLVVSYSSDWLFPTAQSKEIVRALIATGPGCIFR